ncbi:IucA/IucC family protein [Cohnella faecalis]|uniref:IucA/IucC family siderophore biosynthesis protein n=1 Tax=Cohnella faecalis TaxID=2315694 RepID=A0A398CIZ6_9BACL|nr:IucA/IucC family protein [Cohnella faecalis]RIE01179.1 IucA/IucC family siderophore biosynthesis protein [Cohnella faecalis]
MNRAITQSRPRAAERQIMKDLMDAFIAERFFAIDDQTTIKLSAAPDLAQRLYPEYEQAWLYVGDICFLLQESYRQGHQWVSDSPIYIRVNGDWTKTRSPRELSQIVLRGALSETAYAHPGVADFLEGLDIAIRQLDRSLERAEAYRSFAPKSAYDWYVKGEMISSLRDRPFHPLSKAKIGFTERDYENYMAEFGKTTALHWVAIDNDSVVKGCPEAAIQALDVLNDGQRAIIEKELAEKAISKDKYTIIPVHPWQLENIILPDFKKEVEEQTVIVLDSMAGDFLATSSVRSLTSSDASTTMLKLPISVKSLGAARYLPVVKLLNGLVGEKMFRQAVACDETLADKVFLCEEKNWWGYMPSTMGLFDDHPRHLAAQVRVYPREIMEEGYKIIPMSSLGVVERETHFLSEILGEDLSGEDVIRFYTDLAAMFYDVTMRLFKVGIVPEIHGQNCCVVLKDDKVVGLLFRDHDSVRLHQPYLDKHRIQDPGYHIRPGYSNSLYNETLEKLIFYVQSLGTQVNLASITEALSDAYRIPVNLLWEVTETKLREALQNIDIPEVDRSLLRHVLFDNDAWPVKLIIRPLLEADGVPGAMPSGKGAGPNPFHPKSRTVPSSFL